MAAASEMKNVCGNFIIYKYVFILLQIYYIHEYNIIQNTYTRILSNYLEYNTICVYFNWKYLSHKSC